MLRPVSGSITGWSVDQGSRLKGLPDFGSQDSILQSIVQSTFSTGKQMAGQSVQTRVCFAIALAMRELHAALEAQLSKTLIEVGRTSQCEGVSKTRDVKINIVTEDKLAAFEHLQDLQGIGPFEERLIGQRSIGHTMHSAGHLLHFVTRPELTIVDGRTAG